MKKAEPPVRTRPHSASLSGARHAGRARRRPPMRQRQRTAFKPRPRRREGRRRTAFRTCSPPASGARASRRTVQPPIRPAPHPARGPPRACCARASSGASAAAPGSSSSPAPPRRRAVWRGRPRLLAALRGLEPVQPHARRANPRADAELGERSCATSLERPGQGHGRELRHELGLLAPRLLLPARTTRSSPPLLRELGPLRRSRASGFGCPTGRARRAATTAT